MSTFVIIDGNAIIHRAYHAIPPMTTKDGTLVNAVYGFTTMLLKVIEDLSPDYLAVSFDVAGKTFREEVYEKYKANRVPADQALYDQIPLVYEVVRAFGIPIYTKEGFEADDLIGTIIEDVRKRKHMRAIIVTGDMDMLQLVDDRVSVYALRKGLSDIVLFDPPKVNEKYGFGPERVVDYKGLRGDPSDNIPGIKGIGEKTATAVIQEFGSIDALYGALQKKQSSRSLKGAVLKKIQEGEKDALMSRELARIRRDVPEMHFSLDECGVKEMRSALVRNLLQKLEFFSLIKRIFGTEEKAKKTVRVSVIEESLWSDFFRVLQKEERLMFRGIFLGNGVTERVLSEGFFFVDDRAYRVPLASLSERSRRDFFSLFLDEKKIIVGHDLKTLVEAVIVAGVAWRARLFDVMIASYVLNSSTRSHDLRSIASRELGQSFDAGDQAGLFDGGSSVENELPILPKLYQKFSDMLDERGERELFFDVEMKLIPILSSMELNGMAVDVEVLKELSKDVNKTINAITKKIWKEAGEEFNISSPIQLRDVLFEKIRLPVTGLKKGKTGLSTASSELEKLRGLHPVIGMIEEYREVTKLKNTYIDVLPSLVNPKTGRIHTTFNQAVAATGRLSSSDPNLQNIPVRTELGRQVRNAFVAEKGYVLVSADYSQIELRIVASLANDERMIKTFQEGKDIHVATAAAIHGVPEEDVTKDMRYGAKEVNFGVLYGMGAYGLSSRTGISRDEAEAFIEKYFAEYADVARYVEETVRFAREHGYVETLFGRKRYIPELSAANAQLRATGERMAINMPVQGTAADIIKKAMIAIDEKLRKTDDAFDVRMILQVHDELLFEVKKGMEETTGTLIKELMEQIVTLRVPIVANISFGKRWGELK